MDAEAVYAGLRSAFRRERAALLHPEFPLEVIDRRFDLVRRCPLYVTDNYVGQMFADRDGISLTKFARLGAERINEVIAFFATAVRLGAESGHPARMEDPNSQTLAFYQGCVEVLGEGAYFLIYNPAAQDPLDSFDPVRSYADPFPSETVAGLCEIRVGLFATQVHVAVDCADPIAALSRLSRCTQVLSVSSRRKDDIDALWRFFAARDDLVTGRPDTYYSCRILTEQLASYARFAQRHPASMRLLVDGRFYDVA